MVPAGFTVLLGGARSGKSALALRIAHAWTGPVAVIATARVGVGESIDDDLAARVARHRAERPPEWTTLEEADDLAGALALVPANALVIIDCITLWVASAFDRDGGATVERDADSLARLVAARAQPTIAVTNEVGLGVHPETEIGRVFRDTLGRVNATLAAHADRTLFLAAGRAVRLDDPARVLAE
jgi:adenosylcobinamide kinase / adenosylcobinamide-phosphate guanylyltransferase